MSDSSVKHDYERKNPRQQVRPQKRLYSIQEAALFLGRSVWAVREMLWAGKIPYIKDGRRILLDVFDMEKWIEQNKMQHCY